jgi:hypothetical protein
MGNKVTLSLPGFYSEFDDTASSRTVHTNQQLNCVWFKASKSIICTVLGNLVGATISANTIVSFDILAAHKFHSPLTGLAKTNQVLLISTDATNGPVAPIPFSTVEVLPYVSSSQVLFLSSEAKSRVNFDGVKNVVELYPGHELNERDVGSLISIDTYIYTVSSVDRANNLLYLLENIQGRSIFLGSPQTYVKSSPIRPAYYLTGSGTRQLIFRYIVRRGDSSPRNLTVEIPFTNYNGGSRYITDSLDLNGGSLNRFSKNPLIPSLGLLPYQMQNRSIKVDTTIPTVIDFFSTSDEGQYGEGQKIDFQVKFSRKVEILTGLTDPVLYIKVKNYGLVAAPYSSGSLSDTLVFTYTVKATDRQYLLPTDIVTDTRDVSSPMYQNIKILPSAATDYIRSKSDVATLDVDLHFPTGFSSRIDRNISLVGNATRIKRKWSNTPLVDYERTAFSAGDDIIIYVEFTNKIRIIPNGGVPNPRANKPFIYLDVGRSQKGLAVFNRQEDDYTLAFKYRVTANDRVSPGGFFLSCTCKDYYQRTYIELNGTTIVDQVDSSSLQADNWILHKRASVILSESSAASDRKISDIVIENTVPTITKIYSNTSSKDLIYAPGTVIMISLTYSRSVRVYGIVDILLSGETTSCKGRYWSGNNSKVLNFRYIASVDSSTSRLECTSVSAISTQNGYVMRTSDYPVIMADNTIFLPGSTLALGLQSTVSIDSTRVNAIDMSVGYSAKGQPRKDQVFLATSSLGINFNAGPKSYILFSNSDPNLGGYGSHTGASFLSSNGEIVRRFTNLTGSTTYEKAIVPRQFEARVDSNSKKFGPINALFLTNNMMYGNNSYLTLYADAGVNINLETPVYTPRESSNTLELEQKYWWSIYQVQPYCDIHIAYDRKVQSQNIAYIDVNTDNNRIFSRAYLQTYSSDFLLRIENSKFSADTVETIPHFQFEYNGQFSYCVAVTATDTGVFSILEAIRSIPHLRHKGPLVTIVRSLVITTTVTFHVIFQRALQHPINIYSGVGVCTRAIAAGTVYIEPPSDLHFRYPIRSSGSIVMKAKQAVPVGTYQMTVNRDPIGFKNWGVARNSFSLDFERSDGKLTYKKMIPTLSIPRVTWSSFTFTNQVPNKVTSFRVVVCLDPNWAIGDVLKINFPAFFDNNAALIADKTFTNTRFRWNRANDPNYMTFTIINAINCIDELIPLSTTSSPPLGLSANFKTPRIGVLADSRIVKFSIPATANRYAVDENFFDNVSPLGISNVSVEFSSLKPYYDTSVSLNFNLTNFLEAGSGFLYLQLPFFHKGTYETKYVSLAGYGGFSSTHFKAYWHNVSDYMIIELQRSLEPGYYSIIMSPNNVSKMRVSVFGLTDISPPRLAISSPKWSMDFTDIPYFPRILGLLKANMSLSYKKDNNRVVSAIDMFFNFSRSYDEVMHLVLSLPFISTRQSLVDFSFGSNRIIWREWEKKMYIDHVMVGATSIALKLYGAGFRSYEFYVNDMGVAPGISIAPQFGPVRGANIPNIMPRNGAFISASSSTFRGVIEDYPFLNITTVPVILRSELKFSNSIDNVFAPSAATNVSLKLNFPAQHGDLFTFYYPNIYFRRTNNTLFRKYIGPCGKLLDEIPNSGAYDDNVTFIIQFFNPSNAVKPECVGLTDLSWFIPENVGFSAPNRIIQSKSPRIVTKWENVGATFSTGLVPVRKFPTVGFISSSVKFIKCYPGNRCPMLVEVLTSTNMKVGDQIHIEILGLRFANNFATETAIVDQWNRPWGVKMTKHNVYFICKVDIPPTPLRFWFNDTFRPTIATYGVNSIYYPKNNSITLRRGDVELKNDDFEYLQSVDSISNFKITAVPPLQTSKGSRILPVDLKLNIASTTKFVVGDRIIMSAPGYLFLYDAIVPVDLSGSGEGFASAVISKDQKTIILTILKIPPSLSNTMIIKSSSVIQIDFSQCDAFQNRCPVSTTFDVNFGFLENAVYYADNVYSLKYSALQLRFWNTSYYTNPNTRPYFNGIAYKTLIDLNFTFPTTILQGSKIRIFIPQIKNNADSTEPVQLAQVMQRGSAPNTIRWGFKWTAADRKLDLTALANISPGQYNFTIGSRVLLTDNKIIYKNDRSIKYEIFDEINTLINAGYFDNVFANGLQYSSIEFGDKNKDDSISVDLYAVSEKIFNPLDIIQVHIPWFRGVNGQLFTQMTGLGATNIKGWWNDADKTIYIQVLNAITAFKIEIPASNGLKIDNYFLKGVNAFGGIPKISLNQTSQAEYFAHTPFSDYEPLIDLYYMNVSFSDYFFAGSETTINIVLDYKANFVAGDFVYIYLPHFWSTSSSITVTAASETGNPNGVFQGSWKSCNDTLILKVTTPTVNSKVFFKINGLRFPEDGVDNDIDQVAKVSAVTAGGLTAWRRFTDLQYIGALYNSSVSFSDSNVVNRVRLNITFGGSIALKTADIVKIKLPGLDFCTSNANPTICASTATPVASTLADYLPNCLFTYAWNAGTSILTLTPTAKINKHIICKLYVEEVKITDASGFPVSDSTLQPNIEINAVDGPIAVRQIDYIGSVGIFDTNVEYLFSTASSAIQLRLQFRSTNVLRTGDIIEIVAPFVDGTVTSPVSYGDQADNKFTKFFDVAYNNANKKFTLTAKTEILPRLMNIFIGYENNYRIVYTAGTSIHTLSATIASMGGAPSIQKNIDFSPDFTVVGLAAGATLGISSCEFFQNCSFDLSFEVTKTLAVGDLIAVSHPNLNFFGDSRSIFNTLSNTGSSNVFFDTYWRSADNIDNLELLSTNVELLSAAKIFAYAQVPYFPINYQLPSKQFQEKYSIVSKIPRIVSITSDFVYENAMCGDALDLFIEFDKSVFVLNQAVTLLLNTFEKAHYAGGNGSTVLVFTYNVIKPVDVTSLEVLGNAALEFDGIPRIVSVSNSLIQANTSFPDPLSVTLRSNNRFNSPSYGLIGYDVIPVYCQTSAIPKTVSIFINKRYGGIGTSWRDNFLFATGDILDVYVEYNRMVVVKGTPQLNLRGDDVSSNPTYAVASYVNVSYVQWVKPQQAGSFSLNYQGHKTKCIKWDDRDALFNELNIIPALSKSLPVVVTSYGTVSGYEYKIEFEGIAPFIFDSNYFSCPDETVVGIRIDPIMWNRVVFRSSVPAGFNAELLSYKTLNPIVLPTSNDKILVLGSGTTLGNVNLALPTPLGAGSLNVVSNVKVHTRPPVVENIWTNFTLPGGRTVVISGDVIQIFVNFSAPVTFTGVPKLQIRLDEYIDMLYIQPNKQTLKFVPLFRQPANNILEFRYLPKVGDKCTVNALDIASTSALVVDEGDILLASSYPVTIANYVMPTPGSAKSLSASNIRVNANQAPQIMHVFSDHAPGRYGAGEVIIITLQFSSTVYIRWDDMKLTPRIPLLLTSYQQNFPNRSSTLYRPHMYFINGSGTDTLRWTYRVRDFDMATQIDFIQNTSINAVLLKNGYFYDDLNNQFRQSLTAIKNKYNMAGVVVDTSPPVVVRVDSTTPDGTYYPGEVIDLTVYFDKVVCITGPDLAAIELSVPDQVGEKLLARYYMGNNSKEIHFEYVIPTPNTSHLMLPLVQFHYVGTAALSAHLGGSNFYEVTTITEKAANVKLPILTETDIYSRRRIYMDFHLPRVISVKALNPNGLYSAGDVIHIAVNFDQPVMIFRPPVLKLATAGVSNRSAIYISGNYTSSLLFDYSVEETDNAPFLDYVDTRFPPFNFLSLASSLALNTDIRNSSLDRLSMMARANPGIYGRHNDIVLAASEFGGIYRASTRVLFPALYHLPLPGTKGSLSFESAISINTNPPQIRSVSVDIPSGTYSERTVVPVMVTFDCPVVVGGCPRVLFRINNKEQFAEYVSGNKTSVLRLEYVIKPGDDLQDFDYVDTKSFFLKYCNSSQGDSSSYSRETQLYIKRFSANSQVHANLTLPWVRYKESVISPRSILGNDLHIGFSAADFVRRIWSDEYDHRSFSVGDVINLNVLFSGAVNAAPTSYILLSDNKTKVQYGYGLNESAIVYPYVVQRNDEYSVLSYQNEFAFKVEKSCDIKGKYNNKCSGHNLPPPGSKLVDSYDSLTPLTLRVNKEEPALVNINFGFTQVKFGMDTHSGSTYGIPRGRWDSPSFKEGLCDGKSNYYREYLDFFNNKRVILAGGCPNHRYNYAKYPAFLQKGVVEIPLYPVMLDQNPAARSFSSGAVTLENITCSRSAIGVTFNGVDLRSPFYENLACSVPGSGFRVFNNSKNKVDMCGGYSDADGSYHYVMNPMCLNQQLSEPNDFNPISSAYNRSHGPQIGWAVDGFPVYGHKGYNGIEMLRCGLPGAHSTVCLDICGGYNAQMSDVDDYRYRYYLPEPPMVGECENARITNGCTDKCCTLTNKRNWDASNGELNFNNKNQRREIFYMTCFRGCRLGDSACLAQNNTFGTKVGFVPKVKFGVGVLPPNDGTIHSNLKYSTSLISIPTNHLPDNRYDIVSFSVLQNNGNINPNIIPSNIYVTGTTISVEIEFSEAVLIFGKPLLILEFNTGSSVLRTLMFTRQQSEHKALFQFNISEGMAGIVRCSAVSYIALNGGRILKRANFLPLISSRLDIGSLCCKDNCEAATIQLINTIPYVTRVFAPSAGVFSNGEEVDIIVQFSGPVVVTGVPSLVLQIPNSPSAFYLYQEDSKSLRFRYLITSSDFTSCLEYVDTSSLVMSSEVFDGIFMRGAVERILASYALPVRGHPGSLGQQSLVVIDNRRPRLLNVNVNPPQATSGDDIFFSFVFSEVMRAVDINNRDLLGSFASEASSMSVSVRISTIDGSISIIRTATLHSIASNSLIFKYRVTTADPSGTVYFASESPFNLVNSFIQSASIGAKAPSKIARDIQSKLLATVDNMNPVVLEVYSPNTTVIYPFGAGDVLDIYVKMSLKVVIKQTPFLELAFSNRVVNATYIPTNGPYDQDLHFRYTIGRGDTATPLDYNGLYALYGDLRRYSSNEAVLPSILLLAPSFTKGSLGYCCNLRVDTSSPYISALLPLKRAGIYGEGEQIVIVARFTKPVVIYGTPRLELKTSPTTTGIASYISSFYAFDLTLDLRETDVLFSYTVRRSDNILDIMHTGPNAISLNGGSIVHKTMSPTVNADILLRDPADHQPINNMVERQWKFRYPSKVEVLLRDLYHTNAESLTATLEHLGHFSTLFDGCCKDKTFGHSYPKSTLGNNMTLLLKDTGVGYNYLFSDTVADNIARRGTVSQSGTSSISYALLAIDGNTDPVIGDMSVSETVEMVNAWWQVLLPKDSVVRSFTIWPRKPSSFINPITSFVIKGKDAFPQGRFKLTFSNIDVLNSVVTATTDFINYGASAAEVKAKIQERKELGIVDVTRATLPVCGVLNNENGCGVGVLHGYGYKYYIKYLNLQTFEPVMRIIEEAFVGGPVTGILNAANSVGYNGASGETSNFLTSQKETIVTLERKGYFQQVPEVEVYAKNSGADVLQYSSGAVPGSNKWLVPYWVMLFDKPPPEDLETGLKEAIWYQKYDKMGTFEQVVLNRDFKVTYLKIQREGYGSLSLAEVEVYQIKLNTMSSFDRGNPVNPSVLTRPYQPEQSFSSSFNNLKFDGRFLLQINQKVLKLSNNIQGYSGNYGTISDVVLIITDMVGVVHTYYQDLRAELTSLPKYGKLINAVRHTPSPFGDWREAFEVGLDETLVPKDGGRRLLGICYGVDTSGLNGIRSGLPLPNVDINQVRLGTNGPRFCTDNYGVGLSIDQHRVLGDRPNQYFLRYERMVQYMPNLNYLGPDYFTYIIHDGLNIQNHVSGSYATGVGSTNEVTVHSRYCRTYAKAVQFNVQKPIVSICVCAQNEKSIIPDRPACDVARTSLCKNSDLAAQFSSMCQVCFGVLGLGSSECLAQTGRAVNYLLKNQMCDTLPVMDCSEEYVTLDGRESTNYLSLKPPVTDESFTDLGNFF